MQVHQCPFRHVSIDTSGMQPQVVHLILMVPGVLDSSTCRMSQQSTGYPSAVSLNQNVHPKHELKQPIA